MNSLGGNAQLKANKKLAKSFDLLMTSLRWLPGLPNIDVAENGMCLYLRVDLRGSNPARAPVHELAVAGRDGDYVENVLNDANSTFLISLRAYFRMLSPERWSRVNRVRRQAPFNLIHAYSSGVLIIKSDMIESHPSTDPFTGSEPVLFSNVENCALAEIPGLCISLSCYRQTAPEETAANSPSGTPRSAVTGSRGAHRDGGLSPARKLPFHQGLPEWPANVPRTENDQRGATKESAEAHVPQGSRRIMLYNDQQSARASGGWFIDADRADAAEHSRSRSLPGWDYPDFGARPMINGGGDILVDDASRFANADYNEVLEAATDFNERLARGKRLVHEKLQEEEEEDPQAVASDFITYREDEDFSE